MYKKIVTTKTPLRVSFLGGGTDLSNFYLKYSGKVLSTTIDKFIYVTVKEHGPLFFRKYRLNYSKTENKNKLSNIENDIIRETLKIENIKVPLYISSISDLPSNSGLASSSAFTVGLIKALYEFQNKKISNLKLAKLACDIEINKVKSPIGKQDQYATAIGGFNIINFNKDSSVLIKRIQKKKIIKKIFDNSVFIWIGGSRKTNNILKDQNKRLKINQKNLILLKKLATKLETSIKKNRFSIDSFASMVKKSWELKQNFSGKISNQKIKKIYNASIKLGSLGGKVLGAGGGGFLFLIVKKKNIITFKKKLRLLDKNIIFMNLNYYEKGSQILLSLK